MTDFDLIGATGVAVISSYLTLYVIDEVKPKINEDGEYEYSLPGYLLIVGTTLIKLGIRRIVGLFGIDEDRQLYVEDTEITFKDDESGGVYEYELSI